MTRWFGMMVVVMLAMANAANVCAASYSNVVLAANPTTYWRLNETNGSTTAADIATNLPISTGTVVGTVTFGVSGALTNEPSNTAMGDSASGYLHATTVEIGASFSVELWAKSATTNWNEYSCWVSARAANGFIVSGNKDDKRVTLNVFDSSGGNHAYGFTPSSDLDLTQWHYYAMTYDSASAVAAIYIDGQFADSSTLSVTRTADTLTDLNVGMDSGGNTGKFNGALDEVAIYSRVLTSDEIAIHFNAGHDIPTSYSTMVLADDPTTYWRLNEKVGTTVAADIATNLPMNFGAYLGTVTLGVTGALVKEASNTAMGDSASGYLHATTVEIGASFSVELWAKSATTNWNEYSCWVSDRAANGLIVSGNKDDKRVTFTVYDSSGVGHASGFTPSSDLDLTQWHYYAMTYDSASAVAAIYIDGQFAASSTLSMTRTAATLTDLNVGMDSGGQTRKFNGTFDEVAIYSRVLTADRILAHYMNGANIHSVGAIIKFM